MKSTRVNQSYVGRGVLYGVLSCVIVIGVAYLGMVWAGLPFPPFRLFDFMARVLPGAVITWVIDLIVRAVTALHIGPTSNVAKSVEQGIALLQFILLGGVFGGFIGYLRARINFRRLPVWGQRLGFGLALGFSLVEIYLGSFTGSIVFRIVWLFVLMGAWGWALGRLNQWAAQITPAEKQPGISRREAMSLIGTAFAALISSGLSLWVLTNQNKETTESAGVVKNVPTPFPEKALQNRISPAPGTRPEITSNENFYRIDINTLPPEINGDQWQLVLEGMVEKRMVLTLEDVRSRPAYSEYITLSCISNQVGGDLISTTLWTGIRLKDLLEEAGLQPGAGELAIQSIDGFYESVSMQDMMDPRTLLVYQMNGEPLPQAHGYPLRIYIPNRYGMKQPKWITQMEVIAGKGKGYWVDRGWSEEAIVRTTSAIDEIGISENDQGLILAGGIAYAGARSINKVEVQVDDGPWAEAELRVPPLSELTWVQWRYSLPNQEVGAHVARVRAYDGNGDLQIIEKNEPHPNGATGYDVFTFRV